DRREDSRRLAVVGLAAPSLAVGEAPAHVARRVVEELLEEERDRAILARAVDVVGHAERVGVLIEVARADLPGVAAAPPALPADAAGHAPDRRVELVDVHAAARAPGIGAEVDLLGIAGRRILVVD